MFLPPLVAPALADGGNGSGAGAVSLGGVGGIDNATGAGGAGGDAPLFGGGGGGGGGAGETGGAGGRGDGNEPAACGAGGTVAGGAGTPGAVDSSADADGNGGGGGGGGAHGFFGVALPTTALSGGTGGKGGDGTGTLGDGGGGGAGGYGAVVTGSGALGTLSTNATGGGGGKGGGNGGGGALGGNGGSGGIGLLFTNASGATMTIGAGVTVQGGDGGLGGLSTIGNTNVPGDFGLDSFDSQHGRGGAGIVGQNLTIVTAGTIAGGLSYLPFPLGFPGPVPAYPENAIIFNGGDNTLTLQAGAKVVGGIVVSPFTSLTFDQATDATLASSISGPGSVTKIGAGTLVLSNGSTYSGGTSIRQGTLGIGSSAALGSGKVALGGTLQAAVDGLTLKNDIALFSEGSTVDTQAHTLTLSGVLGNFDGIPGALTKTGGGTLVLTNDNTYTGDTTVKAGKLVVNGSILSEVMLNGGTLGGSGSIGGFTATSGVIAPGNSIGTMTVNGNFTIGSGVTYEVEVNDAGQSDKVVVFGTVNLTGAALSVLPEAGTYNPSTKYTIIDNDGADAVVGTFAAIASSLAFLDPSVIYNGGTGNDVVLTLTRNDVSATSVATTSNQASTAGAVDNFTDTCSTDDMLCLAILNQTVAGAQTALDAVSGEIYATVSGVLADDSRYVRDAILGRLMQAGHTGGNVQTAALAAAGPQVASLDQSAMALGYGSKSLGDAMPPSHNLAFWTRAYGAWGDYDTDGNAASASRDLGGFVSGMDAGIGGSWRAGLATGASFSNVDVDARYSSADVETYHLGDYLGGMAGAFALRGGGAWAWSSIDTSRAVVFPGFFEREKASYDADTGQIFGEVAYPTTMGGMAVEPFGGLAFVSLDSDTIKERGAPPLSSAATRTRMWATRRLACAPHPPCIGAPC